MIIRVFLAILVFMVAIFYLSHLNPDTIQLHLWPGASFPVSTSLLILASVVIGAFLMIAIVALRDTRRGFLGWRSNVRLKRKEKIMDLYRQGVNDLLSKKREQALKSFNKILDMEPNNVDVMLRIGDVHRYKDNFDEAIRVHSEARSIAPDNVSVLFVLAKDYRRAGQFLEAAEIYRNILKLDERNVGAFLKLREIYEKEGDWQKAYDLQKGYWELKKNPEEKQRLHHYQLMVARVLDPAKDEDRIVKLHSDLMKADKSMVAPYYELGMIYKGRGDEDGAVRVWKKGFKETGAVVFLEALDESFRKQEDPGAVIKIYKQAVSRFADKPIYKFLLGKFYYRLEMIDDALEIFENLKNQGFDYPIMRQILGDIYCKRGRMDEAIEEFKQSVDFTRPVPIPYSCAACGYEQNIWSANCPQCGAFSPLSINLSANLSAEKPPSTVSSVSLDTRHA
jgi:lipopolysaccharide biosynthesis regulator YciM